MQVSARRCRSARLPHGPRRFRMSLTLAPTHPRIAPAQQDATRLVKIDIAPMVKPAAVRFARADTAAFPDLAASRRESLAAARRLLNDELSSSDAALDSALDRMIDAVCRQRGR